MIRLNSALPWSETVARALTSAPMMSLKGTFDLAFTDSFIFARARASSATTSAPKASRSATEVT
jgi:hypothetical protein